MGTVGLVFVVFFATLLIGVPVAHVVMIAAAVGIILQGDSSPLVLIQTMYEGLNSYILLAVPFFIISGDIAAKGNVSEQIVKVINAWLGRLHGGLGIATIVACIFFGAITGSSIATVVAIGALMLPKLLQRGYPRGNMLGMITCAGTLGVMIPPSICMLITCVAMGTSVGEQFTAGFLPGILTGGAFAIYLWWNARKNKIPVEPKLSIKEKLRITWECMPSIMYPVIVLGGIYSGLTTPTEAGVVSLVYILIVELFIFKKMPVKQLIRVIGESAVNAATLTLTVATAQVFVWYMTTAGLPGMLFDFLTTGITNKYVLWAAIVVLFLIAGCFTNVTNVVIILGPLLKSVMEYYGIDLIHFGIIVVMTSQIGFVSPPFGICLFVAMKIAKASMVEVVKGAIPYLIIMIVITIILILVPDISLFLPNLLYRT